MKATIKFYKEVEVTTLKIRAGVRYWEDGTVNGQEDINGNLIPFREGDYWCPVIDLYSATIKDWPIGTTAHVHYKVCDDGYYILLDDKGEPVLSLENDYVPNKLVPGHYGDYIEMEIDQTGKITNWPSHPSLSDFMEEDD
ncbi:hypothetical protein FKG96_12610 [Olivibacter sp. LS-1]|uniref:hypothetical protein n=1 Tax=Olivibacter sp. LS-1 TaxID=2592345 RepID=UPI0011EB8031|nr:hypothetical protein [Olivibacter sp. LS-1]QEL01614.1 hypothetical protein FKG96_12610 [Olivibacter sp. LS-1]